MKKLASRTFRPWEHIDAELKTAEDLGLNVSQLINEVLELHIREHMKKRASRMIKVLSESEAA